MPGLTIDAAYLTQTLSNLVSINSINSSLVPDGPGEAKIGAYLAEAMHALGLAVNVDEVAPGRVNVIGRRAGKGGGRSLMWNAHMDTVGLNGMEQPFTPTIREGRLYGRGSQDMKGSLAAMLAAVKALNQAGIGLDGDLLLTAVADEEYASLGSDHLVQRYRTDAAIVTEPTDLELALAHRGFAGFEVETIGRAAHGSRYQDGIDAILLMGRFLAGLDALEQELLRRQPHPLVGPPSLHASLIRGGTEMSTYPASCYLMIERRTIPGETVEQTEQELRAILEGCSQADPRFRAGLKTLIHRPPFVVDDQVEIVQSVTRTMTARFGHPPVTRGVSFWTDAAILAQAGIPTVLVGPTGQGLHSAVEWVDLKSCVELAGILAQTAIQFCARGED
jgi:acetylornithine deacetylase/succinyl-diaminopimelate desuccinylase family protein